MIGCDILKRSFVQSETFLPWSVSLSMSHRATPTKRSFLPTLIHTLKPFLQCGRAVIAPINLHLSEFFLRKFLHYPFYCLARSSEHRRIGCVSICGSRASLFIATVVSRFSVKRRVSPPFLCGAARPALRCLDLSGQSHHNLSCSASV